METLLKILAFIGAIETVVLIVGIIWAFVLWTRGIFPVLLRVGNGLAKRKVALFAKNENVNSLKTLLTDSGLFREKNIFAITKTEDLDCAENASVYLVHWHDFSNNIEQILAKKPNECPMIVYAPYNMGRIPDEQMANLDGKRHTAVTNFRGRLLNDIVTALITTGYERKI
jgi:hypothetical protein